MSMEKSYYVIAGFNLTGLETNDFSDWKWTEEGETYLNNQVNGKIQLFDDPMDGIHLYLGYILASGDEYDFKTTYVDVDFIKNIQQNVEKELEKLKEIGVISIDSHLKPDYKIIAFEEYR
jgi:hypothetical protein